MKNKKYKLIIAGSRTITNMEVLEKAINYAGIKKENVLEIISGCAGGIDTLGKWWGERHNIPVKEFPANWEDITTEPVYIKVGRNGNKYNALAGFVRNKKMAEYGDKLLAVWDNNSPGTSNMIDEMKKLKKEVWVYEI